MNKNRSFWISSQGYAAMVLIGAVTYFLLMEHRAHVFQFFPFLILLICPLMHIFMHRNHGHARRIQGEETIHENSRLMDNEAYRKGLKDGRKQSHKDRSAEPRR
jgi:hypothetical protein